MFVLSVNKCGRVNMIYELVCQFGIPEDAVRGVGQRAVLVADEVLERRLSGLQDAQIFQAADDDGHKFCVIKMINEVMVTLIT